MAVKPVRPVLSWLKESPEIKNTTGRWSAPASSAPG